MSLWLIPAVAFVLLLIAAYVEGSQYAIYDDYPVDDDDDPRAMVARAAFESGRVVTWNARDGLQYLDPVAEEERREP